MSMRMLEFCCRSLGSRVEGRSQLQVGDCFGTSISPRISIALCIEAARGAVCRVPLDQRAPITFGARLLLIIRHAVDTAA
jgi:hypothetical protein